MTDNPDIVCLCGSTRFKSTFIAENARLTDEGHIVLSVGLYLHYDRVEISRDLKIRLDQLHKRKIDLCDWVWVLDVNGYIGESTRSEIIYAVENRKTVRYLSREFPDYKEPVDPLRQHLERLIHISSEVANSTNPGIPRRLKLEAAFALKGVGKAL